MKKTPVKTLSVTQYAKLRGIERQAVLQRLTPVFKPMIGVKKAEKIGNAWILHVTEGDIK